MKNYFFIINNENLLPFNEYKSKCNVTKVKLSISRKQGTVRRKQRHEPRQYRCFNPYPLELFPIASTNCGYYQATCGEKTKCYFCITTKFWK